MASSDARATLASGNFLGIINVLMSLRKVRDAKYGDVMKVFTIKPWLCAWVRDCCLS